MAVFIEMTQPQGDEILVNLDNVVRVWRAERGGTGMSFVNAQTKDGLSSCVYKDDYQNVKELLRNLGVYFR